MIKVIDIDGCCGWKKHYLDPNKEHKTWNDEAWYESPVLEKFLNEGWVIKDWKMAKSKNGSDWTFILEKESNRNSNSNIKRISDTCLQVYHWQFIVDSTDEYTINVYETRSGNVIGTLPNNITLPKIEKDLNDFSEEQVYNWIDNNIEYI